MPRDQFLPLNPSKLSGVCGRLKCCLRYELDVYREFQRSCPKVGHPVRDDVKGEGVIEKIDVIREQIQVRYGGGDVEKFSHPEFLQLTNWRPEMPKNECICTCGRKASSLPAQPVTTVEETSIPGVEVRDGEKVSLLPGGGLGLQSGTKGEEIQVGTDLSVPQKVQKKKRKRRRHKKPSASSGTEPAIGSGSAPAEEEDGDEE